MLNMRKIRTFDDFIDLFPGYKDLGSGRYRVNCPCCGSDLIIFYKAGKFTLSCHKGCLTESITAKLGITVQDLNVNSNGFAEKFAGWDSPQDLENSSKPGNQIEGMGQPTSQQVMQKKPAVQSVKTSADNDPKPSKVRDNNSNGKGNYPGNSGVVTLRCMKEVEAEAVSWLWKPYIAKGKLTLLEGDPGEGKSWITLAIAAAVSLGQGLPGQVSIERGSVILVSAEDGMGDTIRPRLDSLQADLSRIHAIDGVITFDDDGFTTIEQYITEVKPILLIIDPLQAYLGSKTDFHRANETRPILSRLARLAEKYSLAILAVRHLSKAGLVKAIYRGLGSIDFTAACRSVLLAGCNATDKQNSAIVQIKSNLAPKGASQGYQLKDDHFSWTGESTLTSNQILAGDNSDNFTPIDDAKAFLLEMMANGPVLAHITYHDAEAIGISKRTLDRAKAQLGIITRHIGEKGRRGGGDWTWELPPKTIDIATNISGNLNNSEAKKPVLPKKLATSISEKTRPNGPGGSSEGLVAPVDDIVRLWNRKGCPGDWKQDGTDNTTLPEELQAEDCPQSTIDAANKWYIENGGNEVGW